MVEHLPPTGDSAYFRSRYPKSWWWTPEMDFFSSLLLAIQAGNWQRGGGRGDKPKRVERPKERKQYTDLTASDIAARKRRLRKARNGN